MSGLPDMSKEDTRVVHKSHTAAATHTAAAQVCGGSPMLLKKFAESFGQLEGDVNAGEWKRGSQQAGLRIELLPFSHAMLVGLCVQLSVGGVCLVGPLCLVLSSKTHKRAIYFVQSTNKCSRR